MGLPRSGDRGGMTKLLQMSLKLATTVARTSVQLVEVALDRVRGGGRSDAAHWTPAPPPPSVPVTPREPWTDVGGPIEPPPPAPDPADAPPVAGVPDPALDVPPVAAAPDPALDVPPVAAAPDPIPDVPPIAAVPEPTTGEAARIREQRREAETTAESPGAEVHVDEPWRGYASMNAPEIIDRLAVSDAAVKAVVLLYENSHRARKTVLRAAAR
jgi:hypothetical protein